MRTRLFLFAALLLLSPGVFRLSARAAGCGDDDWCLQGKDLSLVIHQDNEFHRPDAEQRIMMFLQPDQFGPFLGLTRVL